MKNILSKYIQSNKNGLLLLDLPTGFGKSYSIRQYIIDSLKEESMRKVYYVTNLKDNLPTKDLRRDLGGSFDEKVLILKAYYENILDEWENTEITDKKIIESDEFRKLNSAVLQFKRISTELRENKDDSDRSVDIQRLDFLKENVRTNLEINFRKLVKRECFYNKKTAEKERYIADNEWIQKLYPTSMINKYNVVLLTTRKFFSPIDDFVRKPYHLYNSDDLDNSVVFIDEFDSTKEDILNSIIDESLSLNIDLIRLFLNIHNSLNSTEFPALFLDMVKKSDYSGEYDSVKKIIDENSTNFSKVYTEFNLQYLIKTFDINNEQLLLFDEFNRITVTNDKDRKKLYMSSDDEENYNTVTRGYKKDKIDSNQLSYALSRINSCLDFFYNGISMMASIYMENMNHPNSPTKNYVTKEQTVWSILSLFNISNDILNSLYYFINGKNKHDKERDYQHDKTINEEESNKKNRFLRKGFEFIVAEDSDYHAMQSKFRLYKFASTPEDLLLRVCNHALTIGVSATASIDTCIGNYDISYLKTQLNTKFIKLETKDSNYLKNEFLVQNSFYEDNVDIKASLIDDFDVSTEYDVKKHMLSTMLTEEIVDKYEYLLEGIYDYGHIVSLGYVYYLLGSSYEINSLVYFLNKFPRYNIDFDKSIVNKLLKDIKRCNSFDDLYYLIIETSDFDKVLRDCHELLFKKKKVMLITSYQTLGTGKNIQYPLVNQDLSDIHISNSERLYKDFDAVMLSKPTHLSQNLYGTISNKEKTFAKFLFEQQYLYFKNKAIATWHRCQH